MSSKEVNFSLVGLVGLVILLIGLIGRAKGWDMWAISFEGIGGSIIGAAVVGGLLRRISTEPIASSLERLHREYEVLLRCQAAGLSDVIKERDDIPPRETLDLIGKASHRIWLLTVARQNWLLDPQLQEVLKAKAATCQVRIVLVKPNSALSKLWDDMESTSPNARRVSELARAFLERVTPIAGDLKPKNGGLKTLSKVHHTPFCSFLMVDDDLRITHYLNHLEGGLCPTFTFKKGLGSIWEKYEDEFQILYGKADSVLKKRPVKRR